MGTNKHKINAYVAENYWNYLSDFMAEQGLSQGQALELILGQYFGLSAEPMSKEQGDRFERLESKITQLYMEVNWLKLQVKSHLPVTPHPLDELLDEPESEPVEEPTTKLESKLPSEPVSEPTEEPESEPDGKLVNEPLDEPLDEPVAKSVSERLEELVSEPIDEPESEQTSEPTSEQTSELEAQFTSKYVVCRTGRGFPEYWTADKNKSGWNTDIRSAKLYTSQGRANQARTSAMKHNDRPNCPVRVNTALNAVQLDSDFYSKEEILQAWSR